MTSGGKLKSELHPAIQGLAKIRKSGIHRSRSSKHQLVHFRVVLIRQIVDPAKERAMRINLVLGGEVDEIIIFNVKIWTAKIDLLASVDPFCLDRCPQFLAPEIRTRNVNFISRTTRQSRAG